jgi:hypothetical protein
MLLDVTGYLKPAIEPIFHIRRQFGKRRYGGILQLLLASSLDRSNNLYRVLTSDYSTGLAHVNADDEYINGYVIPKGSSIYANMG